MNEDFSSSYFNGNIFTHNHFEAININGRLITRVDLRDTYNIITRVDFIEWLTEQLITRVDIIFSGTIWDRIASLITRVDEVNEVTVDYAFDLSSENKFMKMSKQRERDNDEDFLERNCNIICLSSHLLSDGTMAMPLANNATQVQIRMAACFCWKCF